MKFKKSYLLIISLISILLCISAVSANDINANTVSDNSDTTIISNDVDTKTTSDNSDLVKVNEVNKDNDDGDDKKLSHENSDKLKDSQDNTPKNTTITAEVKNKELLYNKTVEIVNVNVKDNESKALTNLNETRFSVSDLNGGVPLEFTYNNSIITLNNLNAGPHSLKINFLGNASYNPSETIVNLTIFTNTITTDSTVNVNNHTGIVNITIKSAQDYNGTNLTLNKADFKLNLTYFNGTTNTTKPIDDFNLTGNIISFITKDLNQALVTIYYKSDDHSNYTKPVEVSLKPYIDLKVNPVIVSVDYQSGEFKFQITDNDDGTVVANQTITVTLPSNVYFAESSSSGGTSISSSKSFTTDNEGILIIKNNGISSNLMDAMSGIIVLDAGKYNLTLKSSNDAVLNTIQEVTVNKVKGIIDVANYEGYVGEDIILKYRVTRDNGEVIKSVKLKTQFDGLTVSGENYYNLTTNSTDSYYIRNLGSKLPANTYTFVVSSVDPNVDAEVITRTMTVNKKQAIISANNMEVAYNTGLPLSFTLTDAKTGKSIPNTVITMSIYTGSKHSDYTATTNANGQVKINFLTQLSLGKHKIVLGVSDATYTASSITRYATIKKANAKFTAPKLKTYYNSGKIFQIKVTTKGKAIYNAAVNVRLYITNNRYYKLSGKTSYTGLLKVGLNNLKPGTYKVVISSNDKGFSVKSINSQIKITKAPVKISPSKFKAKSGKKLKIKVIGKHNKKAVQGLKLKVKVSKGKTSKTYNVKTNKKGFAYIKIKQKPGKYKAVISPNSPYYSAKNTKATIRVKK